MVREEIVRGLWVIVRTLPSLDGTSTLAPFCSSFPTTSPWPFWLAMISAVALLCQGRSTRPSVSSTSPTSSDNSVRSHVNVTASAGQRRGDIEMVDYLDRGRGLTNLVLDLSFVHERHGASRADPQVNGKLTFADCKRVDQPLEDKDPQYTQDYANNTRSVFAPAVASTSGRIRGMFRALEEAFAIPHRPAFPQGRRSSFFATGPASSTRVQRAVPPSTQCLTKGGRKTCAASCLQR